MPYQQLLRRDGDPLADKGGPHMRDLARAELIRMGVRMKDGSAP